MDKNSELSGRRRGPNPRPTLRQRDPAAARHKRLARCETRSVGEQEQDHLRYLIRLTDALHRRGLDDRVIYLVAERPGTEYASLDEYYRSLGKPLPDEPVLVVRISKDGETRFLEKEEHDVQFNDDSGQKAGVVTVCELPEDEFWFFQAFRPGLFDLESDLPQFMYDICIVNAFDTLPVESLTCARAVDYSRESARA